MNIVQAPVLWKESAVIMEIILLILFKKHIYEKSDYEMCARRMMQMLIAEIKLLQAFAEV